MSEENNQASTVAAETTGAADTPTENVESLKGKGKAPATDDSMMDEDEDSSSDEEPVSPIAQDLEYELIHLYRVSKVRSHLHVHLRMGSTNSSIEEPEEADEDNMEEIDTENIINDGRRTRGKDIDFAKAAEGLDDEDEDEEDDGDFEDPDEMEE